MSREAHVRFWEGVGVQLLCATQLLVLSERHLRRILTRYFAYYHGARTHLSLEKDAPDVRPIQRPGVGPLMAIPEVGGLHHRYLRRAA
jgi:putative transposase